MNISCPCNTVARVPFPCTGHVFALGPRRLAQGREETISNSFLGYPRILLHMLICKCEQHQGQRPSGRSTRRAPPSRAWPTSSTPSATSSVNFFLYCTANQKIRTTMVDAAWEAGADAAAAVNANAPTRPLEPRIYVFVFVLQNRKTQLMMALLN